MADGGIECLLPRSWLKEELLNEGLLRCARGFATDNCSGGLELGSVQTSNQCLAKRTGDHPFGQTACASHPLIKTSKQCASYLRLRSFFHWSEIRDRCNWPQGSTTGAWQAPGRGCPRGTGKKANKEMSPTQATIGRQATCDTQDIFAISWDEILPSLLEGIWAGCLLHCPFLVMFQPDKSSRPTLFETHVRT